MANVQPVRADGEMPGARTLFPGATNSVVATTQKPILTRLKDLPLNVKGILPPSWDLEKGINEPVDTDGTTPLYWAIGLAKQDANSPTQRAQRASAYNALLSCPDIDLNSPITASGTMPGSTATPLATFLFSHVGIDLFLSLLIMKNTDPKVSYTWMPYGENKLLNQILHLNSIKSTLSPALVYMQGPKATPGSYFACRFFQFLYEATQEIVSDQVVIHENERILDLQQLRNNFPYLTTPIFNMIRDYVGIAQNLDDYSVDTLSNETKEWILRCGKIFYEKALQQRTEYLAKIVSPVQPTSAVKATAPVPVIPTEESSQLQQALKDIAFLKANFKKQNEELAQVKEELNRLKAQTTPTTTTTAAATTAAVATGTNSTAMMTPLYTRTTAQQQSTTHNQSTTFHIQSTTHKQSTTHRGPVHLGFPL